MTPDPGEDAWRWIAEAEVPRRDELVALVDDPTALGGRILRQAPGRTVVWLDVAPETAIVVKVLRDVTMTERVRRRLRTRARTEWRALGLASARGLPVPRRLAVGEDSRHSILVVEALRDHVTLEDLLQQSDRVTTAERHGLVRKLAWLVSAMHQAGMQHRDLHPGNFMVRGSRLVLLDLHQARFQSVLSAPRCISDLVDLDMYFAWHGEKTDRLRFCRAYFGSRETSRRMARELGTRTLRRSRSFWVRRDRRAHTASQEFGAVALPDGSRGLIRRRGEGLALEGLEAALPLSDELLASPDAEIRKHGTSATSGIVSRPGGGEPLFLKRYNRSGLGEGSKILVRGTRARRAFRAGWALEVRGIPTARVLGYLDRHDGLSVLMTEAFPGSQNLADLLGDDHADRDEAWRIGILEQAARITKSLHLKGLSHRDLKTTNLLVSETRVAIIDLDGLVVHGREVPWSRRARDLARLWADLRARNGLVDDSEQEEFMDRYLGHQLEERQHSERLLGELTEALRLLEQRRMARRGAPS